MRSSKVTTISGQFGTSPATAWLGNGWTAYRNSTGRYTIIFNNDIKVLDLVVMSGVDGRVATAQNSPPNQWKIAHWVSSPQTLEDATYPFRFVATVAA